MRRGTQVCAVETLQTSGGRLRVGDVDGDGRRDLVIIGDSEIVSYLEDGRIVTTSAPRLPEHASLADNDADGTLDLVWLFGDVIQTAPGDGAGAFTFDLTPAIAETKRPRVLVFSDVDRDGRLDAIVMEAREREIRDGGSVQEYDLVVLFATDSGSRRGPKTPLPPESSYEIGIADFDGDHALDVLFEDGAMAAGKPDGSFALRATLSTEADGPYRIERAPVSTGTCAADIDGDGDVDLVTPIAGSDPILAIWQNDGTGRFVRPLECNANPTSSRCSVPMNDVGLGTVRFVGVADANGDGHPDLIAEPYVSYPLTLWIAHGATDGSFAPWQSIVIPSRVELVAATDGKLVFSTQGGSSQAGISSRPGIYALPTSCP